MDRTRGLMDEASSLVFKETGTAELRAHIFNPQGHRETDQRTAVAFFSAGVWDNVLISQFAPHCLHFRERGAVVIIFEYRELSKHRTTPVEAITDGRSALRWLRMNHADLGVHPDRIVGAGAGVAEHPRVVNIFLHRHVAHDAHGAEDDVAEHRQLVDVRDVPQPHDGGHDRQEGAHRSGERLGQTKSLVCQMPR